MKRAEIPLPDQLRAILAAGMQWLHDTVQPHNALIQHHGVSISAAPANRSYSFVPDSTTCVVIIDVAKTNTNVAGRLLNPLDGATEMRIVSEILAELGHRVVDQWNGGPDCDTGSLRVATAPHVSLTDAVKRYHAGCPKHGTMFCGWQGRTKAERNCTWYNTGYNRMVLPATPAPCGHCGRYGHTADEHPLPPDHPQHDAFYDTTDEQLARMVFGTAGDR